VTQQDLHMISTLPAPAQFTEQEGMVAQVIKKILNELLVKECDIIQPHANSKSTY